MNGYMTTSTIREISEARGVKMMTRVEVEKLRNQVKEVMWKYYSDNKLSFHESIRDSREEIIVELMKGNDIREVFEIFGGVGILKSA